MNDKLSALLAKGKKMSPMESKASDGVLGSLLDHISGLEGDKVKGIKKVTVASNDPAGLEAGLAKAKAMVAHGADAADADDSDEDAMMDDGGEDHESDMDSGHDEDAPVSEHELDEHKEHDEEDMESLKAQIEQLKAMLASR